MSRFLSTLLLIILAHPLFATTQDDYVGQYVLRLGTRNFLVLNLIRSGDTLTGSLSRPRRSSFGTIFSNISKETAAYPIVSAIQESTGLRLVTQNPNDPSDRDTYLFNLLPPDQASLEVADFPTDPWTLDRVPRQPTLIVSTDWDPHHAYTVDETEQSNPVMQRIYEEDQKPRQSLALKQADWKTINQTDEARRQQVRDLLTQGTLHTGKDFEQAAFIFQHGGTPDDYLLAHTLAMISIARGNPNALWIATATLDRYLNAIQQPQIYGTQYHLKANTPVTQEPYNRTLISDNLRRKLNVGTQATQQKQLEKYAEANKP